MKEFKEPLVTFSTAKLAKEKGFDIPCNTHCFIGNTDKIVFETSAHCIAWGNRPHTKTIQKYSAPTQSLLQKWLREVHRIDCYAYPYKDHQADYNDPVEYRGSFCGNITFRTFEEALEEELQRGLKLIKL